jgi:hypothetical protein
MMLYNHTVIANVFKDRDYEIFETLARNAIKLDTEIEISKIRAKDECLTALYDISWTLDFVRFRIIDSLEDIIRISTKMVSPADEQTVNNIIGTSIARGLKALETSKEKVNHAIGRCSSPIIGSTSGMAIVMPTAQHVLGFLTVVESTLRQMGGR